MAATRTFQNFINAIPSQFVRKALQYMANTFSTETLAATGNATVGGTLGVTGVTTLTGGTLQASQTVLPTATQGAGNTILPGITSVTVGAVVTNADDFIVLPSLAAVPNGHRITILCSAGSNFELRTPASSAEEINSEDCDGTKEYLCTDTQIVEVIKINNTIGWMAHPYTAIGAVAAAVVPD